MEEYECDYCFDRGEVSHENYGMITCPECGSRHIRKAAFQSGARAALEAAAKVVEDSLKPLAMTPHGMAFATTQSLPDRIRAIDVATLGEK